MKRGMEIGNYVLADLLDQGGAGQVWLAYRELGAGGRTAVAIKFPHGEGVLDPRVRDGLDDEARLRMQLQHSNIPRVIDLGLHEGVPYFVMDYIPGRSLAELLERLRDADEPLRFELVAHIAREVGYALRYAHGFELDGVSRPVLHRDVAPKSVLLSGQGAVYVVGFGVSEAAGITSSSAPAKGTLRYMAPEHAMGFPTPKSDGWGLGAIMWEMIEGRQFRAEVDPDDLRRAAKQGRHRPLTREGIPEVLRLVTEGLLQADDRERLTIDEALRQLEAPDLPVQRMALADVLEGCFGDVAHRAAWSTADPEPAEPSEQPPAAAKAFRDDGPFGLDTWRVDPEDDPSLPPPPAWASMEEPADANGDPVPAPPSEASDASAAKDVPAADDAADEAPAPAPPEEPRPAAGDAVADPPMLAVVDLRESSSAEMPKPVVPPVVDDAPPPTAAPAPPKRRSPVLLPVLGLVVAGVAWAAWPRSTNPPPAAPVVAASQKQPADATKPSDQGPPKPAPAPTVVPEPAPTVVPEPTPNDTAPTTPEPATSDAPPTTPEPATSDAAPTTPEPTTNKEPGSAPKPSSQPDEPKASASKPSPKKASGPPVPLAIELLLFADMELEVNGVHFSLGVRKTTAKTTVKPGTVNVRWRRPLGKWKRKSFDVDAGASYDLLLDDRGPKLRQRKK